MGRKSDICSDAIRVKDARRAYDEEKKVSVVQVLRMGGHGEKKVGEDEKPEKGAGILGLIATGSWVEKGGGDVRRGLRACRGGLQKKT